VYYSSLPPSIFTQDLHNTQSTVGIECTDIKLAGGEVSVWDFAGQLEYTSTHQFFLSIEVLDMFFIVLICSPSPLPFPLPHNLPLCSLFTCYVLIDGGLSAVL
jgi:hypothetical protein